MNHNGSMSISSRSAVALLLLRLSVGLSACWNAWPHLHGYGLHGINVRSGLALMVWLLQFLCGGMLVLGLLMPWSCIPLLILAASALRWPPQAATVFSLLLLLAAVVGGPGKWALSKS